MTYTTRELIYEASSLVAMFGLSKPAQTSGNNEPRVFPYGVEGNDLYEELSKVLDTRENYLEFIEHYKDLIFTIEDEIVATRRELRDLDLFGDPKFARRYLQSKAKLLGNVAHKLYYLRTNARSWRREINLLLATSPVGAEA